MDELAEAIKERNQLRAHLMEFAQWAADDDNVMVGDPWGTWCVLCEADFSDHAPDCLHLFAQTWLATSADDGAEEG